MRMTKIVKAIVRSTTKYKSSQPIIDTIKGRKIGISRSYIMILPKKYITPTSRKIIKPFAKMLLNPTFLT